MAVKIAPLARELLADSTQPTLISHCASKGELRELYLQRKLLEVFARYQR